VLSIHAHHQGQWLVDVAHQAIDAGADVVFGHGPHAVRGVEIYKCKPIFYSLGDFVLQNKQIERLPWEFYARYGLGDEATPEDAQNARSKFGTRGLPVRRNAWEGIAAVVYFRGGEVARLCIIPVDLGFGKPVPIRGTPKLAGKELGRTTLGNNPTAIEQRLSMWNPKTSVS
jgi:Bacterial capsule synthesis protein PGA_cap